MKCQNKSLLVGMEQWGIQAKSVQSHVECFKRVSEVNYSVPWFCVMGTVNMSPVSHLVVGCDHLPQREH